MTTNIMLAVGSNWFDVAWYWYALVLVAIVGKSGFVLIRERQVGIVIKRFATKSLPPGHLLALEGEAGYQADTLAPGLHFGYWPWQYRIIKVPVTVVEQGEIALVMAADGVAMPSEHILGKRVECDNFQDARKFLLYGGEKGRQLGILTAGTYRINTALFSVVAEDVLEIADNMVGIVTTKEGRALKTGDIAGLEAPGSQEGDRKGRAPSGGGLRRGWRVRAGYPIGGLGLAKQMR